VPTGAVSVKIRECPKVVVLGRKLHFFAAFAPLREIISRKDAKTQR
jgi:hypothetical protein